VTHGRGALVVGVAMGVRRRHVRIVGVLLAMASSLTRASRGLYIVTGLLTAGSP
jgi:hypothetical protein